MSDAQVGDRVSYTHEVAIHMAEFHDVEGYIQSVEGNTALVLWNNGDKINENLNDLVVHKAT